MNHTQFSEKVCEYLIFLEKEKNVAAHTLRAYRSDLRQFEAFWQRIASQQPEEAVTPDRVAQRYVLSLFYEKIAKATLARKISCLRSISAYLKQQGISLKFKVQSPKVDRKIPVTLSVDEITYLLDTITIKDLPSRYPYRDRAIMEMLYATGVRCAELTHMRLCDIDMKDKSVRVFGKGGKERIALFGDKAKIAVEDYITNERAAFCLDGESYLFLGPRGTRLTERTVQRTCEMYRKLLKVDRQLTPHKIRHSFATHLLHQGVDLRVIQELLGHSTLSTVEIYTHVSSAHLAKVCDEKHPLNQMNIAGSAREDDGGDE